MTRFVIILSMCLVSFEVPAQRVVEYVNPFIGTAAHGHTYPGATVPFGMVQLSPDNGSRGWDWCSGYNYMSYKIAGFSHTHLSGTGIGDFCDISVMPLVNEMPSSVQIRSSFSHEEEVASPGYYSVMLKDFQIRVELTATAFAGIHRYTFPKAKDAMIRFNLGFAINDDSTTECYFTKINDSTFAGYRFSTGWAADQRIFFAVRLNKPVKDLVLLEGETKIKSDKAKNKNLVACLLFDTKENERIEMKVGLSTANIEGAMAAINQIQGLDFDILKKRAEQEWETELSKIKVKTNRKELAQTFYTALYHTDISPVLMTDALGNYKGVKGDLQHSDHPVYTISSLWDVFRAENPLLTITQPKRVPDIIQSYFAFYQQNNLLPIWDFQFNETNTMTGYHSVPVIADALLKGLNYIEEDKLYAAMKKSAMQDDRGGVYYRKYGYVPQDKYGNSVTITMEYAYDDWCIAQVARKLGKAEDYNNFMKRSGYWKNVFDAKTGFARARDADGQWEEPFDPYFSDEDHSAYTEGNAWQHSWFVPQDVYGMISAYGGENKFIAKLDSTFSTVSTLNGKHVVADISGMIGQYAQGNEPSHHIAYLYNYAGKPYKTAERVHDIMNHLYTNKPDGLCGNEDCGQMSAWYVFSALGFYPVNPASGEYVIGTPSFDSVDIQVENGKIFSIRTKELTAGNIYIQNAILNGAPYGKSYISHNDIMQGGELILVMGSEPSSTWGISENNLPGKN
jgi:predicted alpha-1,2-mannosidase